jgi:hypothetical protein
MTEVDPVTMKYAVVCWLDQNKKHPLYNEVRALSDKHMDNLIEVTYCYLLDRGLIDDDD